MRPYRPGYWWYKTSGGRERIADIASSLSYELCVFEIQRLIRISVFECSSEFGEWLCQAHPPKKVDRYGISVGISPDDLRAELHEHGPLVLYDDVKEYLLEGMEPFETDGCLFANLEQEDNEE
jgi:hypothetical protein